MSDFVRNDVRLREVARRAEALVQFSKKTEIQIDLRIRRTVERPDGRRAHPARRLDGIRARASVSRTRDSPPRTADPTCPRCPRARGMRTFRPRHQVGRKPERSRPY